MQEFKDIPNFPEYKINKQGVVLSYKNDQPVQIRFTKLKGFKAVKLYANKQSETVKVSDLINITFPPYTKPYFAVIQNDQNTYRLYDSTTKTIRIVNEIPKNVNKFEALKISKKYENTDESLLKFVQDFDQSCEQLLHNPIFKFDYKYSYNDYVAVVEFFNSVNKRFNNIPEHEEQTIREFYWTEKCYNGYLLYCEAGTYQCYGYDYSFNHGAIMSSEELIIPTKKGKEYRFKKLPDKLLVGYYHVMITCNDPQFLKIFKFSKDNVYDHQQVAFAIEFKDRFNISIELVNDNKPNAYLYKNEHLTTGKQVFENWYLVLVALRSKYPENILLKWLCSTLHGQLSSANSIRKTMEQMEEEKLFEISDVTDELSMQL